MKIIKIKNPRFYINAYEMCSFKNTIYYKQYTIIFTTLEYKLIYNSIEFWTQEQRYIPEVIFELLQNEDIQGLKEYIKDLKVYAQFK